MPPLILSLPFPPSVNHYLKRSKFGTYKTKEAKAYEDEIALLVMVARANKHLSIPVEIEYLIWFPDNRRRDIANYEKVLTDSLVKAGVMEDDHLVHKWVIERKGVVKGGKICVTIKPYT